MWLNSIKPFWPEDSLQNKPSSHKPFHLNSFCVHLLKPHRWFGLESYFSSVLPSILHAIQENVQADVQSSPETSQGGEGVQSGLGKMETMPHWEILDEMLAHILWQQPTFSLAQNFFISQFFLVTQSTVFTLLDKWIQRLDWNNNFNIKISLSKLLFKGDLDV